MIKKIDAYILRKFLGTFFYTLLLFAIVASAIDLSENLDEFVEEKVPIGEIILGYYANFVPELVFMLTPIFLFVAVIFFTSKLASRSEIVGLFGTGVSFYRLLWGPYFVGALILVGLQLLGNHYFVPKAAQNKFEFEREFLNKNKARREQNIYLQTDSISFVTLSMYNPRDSSGRSFVYERIQDGQLKFKVLGDRIRWNTDRDTWEVTNFVSRELIGDKEILDYGQVRFDDFNLLPSDFGKKLKERSKGTMTTPELNRFIARERQIGSTQLAFFLVEKHRRTAIPFATIILTFIALAIASRKTRGGMGWHILVGFALSGLFVVFLQFSTTFATNGTLSPQLAVWIPNIIFGLICIVMVRNAPK